MVSQSDVIFDSKFEGGNLDIAIQVADYE